MADKRQVGRIAAEKAATTASGTASKGASAVTALPGRSTTSGTASLDTASRSGFIEGTEDGRTPRPWFRRWGWWLLPLTVLGLLVGTIWGVNHIQNDIQNAAPEILREAGIDPAGLEFDASYRNVRVSGDLPAGVTAAQVEALLEDGEGPGEGEDIRNATVVATEAAPAQFGDIDVQATSDGQTLTLTGTVPSQAHADRLVGAAEASGAEVIDNLTVSGLEPSAADADGQIDRLAGVLPSLGAGVAGANLALTNSDLSGSIDALDAASATSLSGLAGDGVSINSPGELGSLDVNAAYDGSTIVLEGDVLTDAQSAELEAVAVAQVGAGNVTNNLNVLGLEAAIEGGDPKVTALAGVIGTFGGLDTAIAALTDSSLTVDGAGPAAEGVDAANAAISAAAEAGVATGGTVTLNESEVSIEQEIDLLQAELDSLQDEIRENVVFASDSDELTDRAKGTLDKVVAAMTRYGRPVVETGGHTDSQGSEEYNLELSQRRSDSVVAYLVGQGISTERLRPVGFGESEPIADNDTDTGRLENRRVEFIAKEQF